MCRGSAHLWLWVCTVQSQILLYCYADEKNVQPVNSEWCAAFNLNEAPKCRSQKTWPLMCQRWFYKLKRPWTQIEMSVWNNNTFIWLLLICGNRRAKIIWATSTRHQGLEKKHNKSVPLPLERNQDSEEWWDHLHTTLWSVFGVRRRGASPCTCLIRQLD